LLSLEESPNETPLQSHVRELLISLGKVMLDKKQSSFTRPSRNPLPLPDSAGIYHRDISLALISLNISQDGNFHYGLEAHVKAEAALAVALVYQLRKCAPHETIFVATPHRIQRQAVRLALSQTKLVAAPEDDDLLVANAMKLVSLDEPVGLDKNVNGKGIPVVFSRVIGKTGTRAEVTVDTVERLQGSEAGFVICLFSQTHQMGMAIDTTRLSFLLNRRRLNVAISRAKTLCIFVTSKEVLRPPASILADQESAKGYMYLRSYEERACCAEVNVNLDDCS
jgi:AAA domain